MDLFITLLIIILIGLIITCGYVIYNLYTKISIYERWVSDIQYKLDISWKTMKELDERQMFEKDDDVGIVFEQIKTIIDDLNDKLEIDDAES